MNLQQIKEKALFLLEKAKEEDYFEQLVHFSHLSGCEHINDYDNKWELTEFATFSDDESSLITKKQREEENRLFNMMLEDCKEELGFNINDDLTPEQQELCWEFEKEWHEDGSDLQLLQLEISLCYSNPWQETVNAIKISVYTSYNDSPYYRGGELLQETTLSIEEFLKLDEVPTFKLIEGL